MDRVYLTITGIILDGGGMLHVQSTMQATWGVQVSEDYCISSDNDPSAALSMVKGKVITWAANPINGSKTLSENQVIVVGGLQ